MASAFAIAFAIGIVSGLRTFTAPMVVSWAAVLGWINLQGSWAEFVSRPVTAYILTALALAEIVNDKLPKTPSRKSPGPFAGRIMFGGVSGVVMITAAHESPIVGGCLGALGAVAGTLGGYAARTKSVAVLKCPDFVIALIEDAIAVGGGFLLVASLR